MSNLPAGLISDAVYPTSPGTIIYAATFPSLTQVSKIVNAGTMTMLTNCGGNV